MNYAIVYWYPNQSKIYSCPQVHFCDSEIEYQNDMRKAMESGYEIVCSGSVEQMRHVIMVADYYSSRR